MVIYKITNKINNKVYIGQTIHTLEHRKGKHIRAARAGVDYHLYRAMNKYGFENFDFEAIAFTNSKETLDYLESYYIDAYDSINNGYNMREGGKLNAMSSKIVYDKHHEKMQTKEVKEKISKTLTEYRKTHPFTEEHRRRISESMKGNHNFTNPATRSIGCYCEVDGKRYDFSSYKDAGLWWYKTYKPFGESYSEATYRRKIIDCIKSGKCTYNNKVVKVVVDSDTIKWFKK